jgi:uncharacterized membrane protein
MEVVLLYAATGALLLGLDLIGLPRLVLPVFRAALGDTLRREIRVGPALGFYLCFVAAVLWLVTAPALAEGTGLGRVALDAAVLGFAAYGTYEFTNLATIQGWTWRMVVVDLSWGTMLTTVAATLGLAVTRAVMVVL